MRPRRLFLAGVSSALCLGAAAGGAVASEGSPWEWFLGNPSAYVAGADSLDVYTAGDLNVLAGHVRLQGKDGNFEFEHSASSTQINAYRIGTPTRTPITIGLDDGQDVLSLMVSGVYGQKHDVQQWLPGEPTNAAVDGYGRLRLNGVTLSPEVKNGKLRLHAILSDGTQLVLAEVALPAKAAKKIQ